MTLGKISSLQKKGSWASHSGNSSESSTPAVSAQSVAASPLILPGTFKSMLNPDHTGDIFISIEGITTLDQLLNKTDSSKQQNASRAVSFAAAVSQKSMNAADDSGANENGDGTDSSPQMLTSGSFEAHIQLSFRSQSFSAGSPPGNGQEHSTGQVFIDPNSPHSPSRKKSFTCLGKAAVSDTDCSGDESSDEISNPIKQYDMMFVQSDFVPGDSYFAVTFSKTLIKSALYDDESSHFPNSSRGLMLSGHYSNLRPYDVGTVRVHLPISCLQGRFAPQTPPQTPKLCSSAPRVDEFGQFDSLASSNASASAHNSRSASNSSVASSRSQNVLTPPGFGGSNNSISSSKTGDPASPYASPRMRSRGNSGRGNLEGGRFNQNGGKPIRYCYGCGDSGHLHKDCPRDQLFCYNCNQTGHSSKNCKKPKPWEQQKQPPAALAPNFVPQDPQMPMAHPMPPHMAAGRPMPLHNPAGAWNMRSFEESLPNFVPQGYVNPPAYGPPGVGSPMIVSSLLQGPGVGRALGQNAPNKAVGSPRMGGNGSPDMKARARGYTTGSPDIGRPNAQMKKRPSLSFHAKNDFQSETMGHGVPGAASYSYGFGQYGQASDDVMHNGSVSSGHTDLSSRLRSPSEDGYASVVSHHRQMLNDIREDDGEQSRLMNNAGIANYASPFRTHWADSQ